MLSTIRTTSSLDIGEREALAEPHFGDGRLGVEQEVSGRVALPAARMRERRARAVRVYTLIVYLGMKIPC